MYSKLYWLIVVLMLGSVVMGACTQAPGAQASPTAAPTETPTAQPAAPTPAPTKAQTTAGGFPLGDFEPDHKLDADWVSFRANDNYVIAVAPREIPGKYAVDGDTITLNESSGVCLNHPGTYHWEFDGKVLTLKAINETCTASERAADLSGRTWILTP